MSEISTRSGRIKIKPRREWLAEDAKAAGLYFRTNSPGDGVTRYRFFKAEADGSEPNGYFGPANGIHTALGLKGAETFLAGYVQSLPAPYTAIVGDRIGYLVGAHHVLCDGCAEKESFPESVSKVPLFRVNIGDYRQACHRCAVILVEGKTPAWPMLFDVKACAWCPVPQSASTASCIRDGCGAAFDPTIPETRDPALLRAFWMRYCPRHREAPEPRMIITEQRS